MYNIAFYEEGCFFTNIGGSVQTLAEAIDQVHAIAGALDAQELEEYFGYKFDRSGTICALVVTDRWGFPVKNFKEEED
jgi:hypothetical protein